MVPRVWSDWAWADSGAVGAVIGLGVLRPAFLYLRARGPPEAMKPLASGLAEMARAWEAKTGASARDVATCLAVNVIAFKAAQAIHRAWRRRRLPDVLRCDFGWSAQGWKPASSSAEQLKWRPTNFWYLDRSTLRYRSARTAFELYFEDGRWVVRGAGESVYGFRSAERPDSWDPESASGLWFAHVDGKWLALPWVSISAVHDKAQTEYVVHSLQTEDVVVSGAAEAWDAPADAKQQIYHDVHSTKKGHSVARGALVQGGLLANAPHLMERGTADCKEVLALCLASVRRHVWLRTALLKLKPQGREAVVRGLLRLDGAAAAAGLTALHELLLSDAEWLQALDDAATTLATEATLRSGATLLDHLCLLALGRGVNSLLERECARRLLLCVFECAAGRPPMFLRPVAVAAARASLAALLEELFDEHTTADSRRGGVARKLADAISAYRPTAHLVEERRRMAAGLDGAACAWWDALAEERQDRILAAECPDAFRCPITHAIRVPSGGPFDGAGPFDSSPGIGTSLCTTPRWSSKAANRTRDTPSSDGSPLETSPASRTRARACRSH